MPKRKRVGRSRPPAGLNISLAASRAGGHPQSARWSPVSPVPGRHVSERLAPPGLSSTQQALGGHAEAGRPATSMQTAESGRARGIVDQNIVPFQSLQSFKDQLQVSFFMEIIILMCRTIWKARNGMIFRRINPNLRASKENFRDELQLLLLRAKRSDTPGINQWIADLA